MTSADLTGWLLTYALHSTVLLLATWMVSRRMQSHRVREALWKTALFGGFFTATAQTIIPQAPLAGRMVVTAAATVTPKLPAEGAPESALAASTDPDNSTVSRTVSAAGASLPASETLVSLLWAGGAGLLCLVYITRRIRFARRIANRTPVLQGPAFEMLDQLQADADITRTIRLTASAHLPSPVALGRSEIAVPSAALVDLDAGQQRSMLAHELAHLERNDPRWLTAACLAECIGFFQPLNRLARRRMQESAEYLCDEWAVRSTGSGVLLAKCLAKVAEWLDAAPRSIPLAGMAEDRSHLVDRVKRLLDGKPFPTAPGRRTLMIASLAALVVTVLAFPAVSLAGRQTGSESEKAGLESQTKSLERQERMERAKLDKFTRGDASGRQPADTGRAIVLALIGVLKDPSIEVRRAAVRSIAKFDDRIAIPALREALKDADAEVRVGAIEGLGELEDAGSADAIAALIKDSNKEVRAEAIDALTNLELSSAPAGLLDALKDPDADVRHRAAHAVGHFQDERAVATLRTMFDDTNADVREAAVEALGEIRNEAAIQALMLALKARDPKVRLAAADALGKR